MNEHERWSADLPAYALDALQPDERAAFERHLAGCPGCRRELADVQAALRARPAALGPSPELRERIMRTVRDEAALRTAAEAPGAVPGRPGPAARGRRAGRRRVRWTVALAAAAAVGVALVLVFAGDDPVRTLRGETQLAGAHVEMQVRADHSTLVAEDLPAPPAGRVYQVWIKRRGAEPAPTRALFAPQPGGRASVDLPGSMEGVEAVLVTDEPRGGLAVPTRPPVIAFQAS